MRGVRIAQPGRGWGAGGRPGVGGAARGGAGGCGNAGGGCGDAAGKHLAPSFVHSVKNWISSNHVGFQGLWICRGWETEARGSARTARAMVARTADGRRACRSGRVNGAATLPNSVIPATSDSDCVMFAVTDIGVRRLSDSSVCRVSQRVSGYGDALVNSGRIAATPGELEFGLSLLCPNVSRPVWPIVANKESMPQEADPRRCLPGCAPPAAHPGTQTIPAGVFQVFRKFSYRKFETGRKPGLKY
ncbi:hypothetical protein APR12_002702 [Nocardia amikacinitolerans]|nr:hypothetical protein [Nocardia amikacinitolerans]